MLRPKLPTVIVGTLLVVAAVGLVWTINSAGRPPVEKPNAVVSVSPPAGDLDLRQVSVGVTLAAGYSGNLFVDGVQVPEDELRRVPALYQITLQPQAGGQFNLGPGRHCASVRYWPLASPTDQRDSPPWCFNLH
jgi:hypothetical protein